MNSAYRVPAGLALRFAVVFALLTLLAFLIVQTELYASAVVVALVLVLFASELVRYAGADDRDLLRAIQAMGEGDLLDRPKMPRNAQAGSALATAFEAAIDRLRRRHAKAESERARLQAMVEHVPVALLVVEPDGRIGSVNRAALRFFGTAPLERETDLLALAPELRRLLDGQGGRAVVEIGPPRARRRAIVSVARTLGAGMLSRGGEAALVSIQSIEGELEASELKAWEEVTRVLAHEIMNSLTPVATLAETALRMIDDTRPGEAAETLPLLTEPLDAIHRRSEGLMRFIDAYRRFAEPPAPVRRMVPVATVLRDAARLAETRAAGSVAIGIAVEPVHLTVSADPELVEQMLLNLLLNAIEATSGAADARVTLSGGLAADGRVVLEVADNGPGIAEGLRQLAFVPFFTTKQAGSGIGLTIVRQIMLAHGGTVELAPGGAGARFRMVF